MSVASRAARIDNETDHSFALDVAVRLGLVAYGLVHLVIAWLAFRLALGGGGNASSKGALNQLATTTPGRLSLYLVGAGMAALVVWQLLEALVGHREEDGFARVRKRVTSAGKAVVYGVLGLSAVKVAIGARSGGGTDGLTAKLMSMPGGPVIVALVGAGVLVVAGFLAHRGWTGKFMKKLDVGGRTGKDGRAHRLFGKAGYLTKALALAIIGGLFIWAAFTHDPQKSGGLDQALHKLLQAPFGLPLLVAVAVGIACYGLFCLAWARHLEQ
ncbi:MAG: DUF1206 domain-containing protein [Nocardioidaceae bacterium]